jgi:hypothetical protein
LAATLYFLDKSAVGPAAAKGAAGATSRASQKAFQPAKRKTRPSFEPPRVPVRLTVTQASRRPSPVPPTPLGRLVKKTPLPPAGFSVGGRGNGTAHLPRLLRKGPASRSSDAPLGVG